MSGPFFFAGSLAVTRNRFFNWLEASAREFHDSVRLVMDMIKSPADTGKRDDL